MTTIESSRVIGFCVALGCGAGMLACGGGGTDTPTVSPVKTGSGGSDGATTSGASGSDGTTTGGVTTGAGGSGQGGGAAACTSSGLDPVPTMSAMISDFDGEAGLGVQTVMPGGNWALDTDKTGMTDMKVDACGTTDNGLHFTGSGHTGWGADVGAAFIDANAPVDASQFTGISFTIKGAQATTVIVKLQNPDSEPPFCKCGGPADAPAYMNCYAGYTKTITVSTEATPVTLTWNQVTKVGWGYHTPSQTTIDPKSLISVAFAVEKGDFDLCIDDLKFVK